MTAARDKPSPAGKSFDEYVTEWTAHEDSAQWWKGDHLVSLVTAYGEATMTTFAEKVDEAVTTLYTYREVAAAYPPDSRRREISWSVHREFVGEDDRLELIKDDTFNWTSRTAREYVRARKRREAQGIPEPAPEVVQAQQEYSEAQEAAQAARRREQAAGRQVLKVAKDKCRHPSMTYVPYCPSCKRHGDDLPADFGTGMAVRVVKGRGTDKAREFARQIIEECDRQEART